MSRAQFFNRKLQIVNGITEYAVKLGVFKYFGAPPFGRPVQNNFLWTESRGQRFLNFKKANSLGEKPVRRAN